MERSCSARLAPVGRVRGLGAATSFALGAATSRQRWLPAVDIFLVDDINIRFIHEKLAGRGHAVPARFAFSKGANDFKQKRLGEPKLTLHPCLRKRIEMAMKFQAPV